MKTETIILGFEKPTHYKQRQLSPVSSEQTREILSDPSNLLEIAAESLLNHSLPSLKRKNIWYILILEIKSWLISIGISGFDSFNFSMNFVALVLGIQTNCVFEICEEY